MNLIFKTLLLLIVLSLTFFLFARTMNMEISGLDIYSESETGNEHEEDDDDKDDDKILIVDGYKAVALEEEIIESAGIKFDKLYDIDYRPEFSAYAEVMDITPLVTARSNYLDLKAEQSILKRRLFNLEKMLQRAVILHKAKSLSTRELEQQRAQRDAISAELAATKVKINNLIFSFKSTWGNVLAELVLDETQQNEFERVARHETSLILVELLKEQSLKQDEQDVFINSQNERESAQIANYVDRAFEIKNPMYGESYVYSLKSDKLRPGMRLFAWVEKDREAEGGLFIPDSAVVWYANEPWVYVKQDDVFIRKPITETKKIANGWLEQRNLFRDAVVVIQGSQTLLSEEFKWAIPDEDDD